MSKLRDIFFYDIGGILWRGLGCLGRRPWRYSLRQARFLELLRELKLMAQRNLPFPEGLMQFSVRKWSYLKTVEGGLIFLFCVGVIRELIDLVESPTFLLLLFFAAVTLPIVFRLPYRTVLYFIGGAIILCLLLITFFPEKSESIFGFLFGEEYEPTSNELLIFVLLCLLLILIRVSQRTTRINYIMRHIATELRKGKPLSRVLGETFRISPFHIALLENGEKTGRMVEAIDCMIGYEKLYKCRVYTHIIFMLYYPLVLCGFFLLIYTFIYSKIFPKLILIFTTFGCESLPFPTDLVLNTTRAVCSFLFSVNGVIVIVGLFIFICFVMPTISNFIPILRRLKRRVITAKMFSLVGYALRSGVPVGEALRLSRRIPGMDLFFKFHFKRMQKKILAGKKITSAFKDAPIFAKDAVALAMMAEDAGILDRELPIIGEQQFEQAFEESSRIGTYLEPAIHIIIAVVIFYILLSVYIPLLSMPIILRLP
ncbi:type II secretion system F family protein [Candidatus Sumerlaeota bacterium]|nr:type II secretion system F family protein [Candidatus Sumerlaeota bacterium]